MGMSPNATGKDGSQTLCKAAKSEVDATIGAVAFGPFNKGAVISGFWMHGNTGLGYTPNAVKAVAVRSLDGVSLGSVTTVADGLDLLGGFTPLDNTVGGGQIVGVPVLLAGRSFYPVNYIVDEYPYIVVYFGGTGISSFATIGLLVGDRRQF